MAKKPVAENPNQKLCQTCDSKVNWDRSSRSYIHSSRAKEADHPALKVHTYAELQDKLKSAMGWSKVGKIWVKPAGKAEKPSKGTRPRKTQAEVAKGQAERAAATAARRAEKEDKRFLKKEYYHPKLGYHFPLSASKQAVADPERGGQLFVPATGEYKDAYLEIPPKNDSAEGQKINAALDHISTHPGHRWEEVHQITADGKKVRVSSAGMAAGVGQAIESGTRDPKAASKRDYRQQVVNWAHEAKGRDDAEDQYEYAVVRPTVPDNDDYRNVPYTRSFSIKTRGSDWYAFRRKRFCAQCAPTVTSDSGDEIPNPSQTVDRSSVPEYGLGKRTKISTDHDLTYMRLQIGAGPTRVETSGAQPWRRAVRTPKDHFETGTGEGRG